MNKFRWILLSGLLLTGSQIAQAQSPDNRGMSSDPRAMSSDPRSSGSSMSGMSGQPGGGSDVGGISNVPTASTTTTTTTTGISPDAQFVPADDAAFGDSSSDSSSMPDTGGEPMIAVLAGLSIAGAALVMRRKVTA